MPLLISYVVSICIIVMFRGEINLDAEEIKESKVIQEDAEMVEVRCCLFGLLVLSVPIHTFSQLINQLHTSYFRCITDASAALSEEIC